MNDEIHDFCGLPVRIDPRMPRGVAVLKDEHAGKVQAVLVETPNGWRLVERWPARNDRYASDRLPF